MAKRSHPTNGPKDEHDMCADMCVDMCADMCVGMCVSTCVSMRMDVG